MPYSQDLINTLQGYVSAAQSAIAAGNNATAISNISSYYNAQTSMRGYASDALMVVNNTGLFGAVANQELSNALGQDQYAAFVRLRFCKRPRQD